jgi:hypothetical protein
VGPEQEAHPSGRIRVADVLDRDPALEVDLRLRLVRDLEAERVGAALDLA